ADEKIGVAAMSDLLTKDPVHPSKVKLVIGATNVGEDKYDHGPLVREPYGVIRDACPDAMVFDLYAGCPGFNVAVEVAFVLSLAGVLKAGDLSVVVGAENIHRARPFKPLDTANIIFGDDALATALRTATDRHVGGDYSRWQGTTFPLDGDFVTEIARALLRLSSPHRIEGIIVDNQLGELVHRVPAMAARVQHRLVELMHPQEVQNGSFTRFTETLNFYDREVRSFAFDIMSLRGEPGLLEKIARAYIESGKCATVASVFLSRETGVEVALHRGERYGIQRPSRGIVDTHTRTHGCFAAYIQGIREDGDVFGQMNGKGVFLYATRGARGHLEELLIRNGLTLNDIDLLVEHQANFAMIPITLERLLDNGQADLKAMVRDYIAERMVTNIHTRGNCSVVSMQRLPYDLQRGALQEDVVQGYPVNRNLEKLAESKRILFDSVGAGMTRSSFLQRL
ncbi:MAG: hypothetical protein JXL84_00950, partial [Deltaproteobacteria bacterium]|nr:hypothetical protein [Deltaproteobacteria bacterium]